MFSTLAELQALFDFTAEDLAENRAGQLSLRQLQRIKQDQFHASIERSTSLLTLLSVPACILSYFLVVVPNAATLGVGVLCAIALWFGVFLPLGTTLIFRLIKRLLERFIQQRQHWLLRRLAPPDPRLSDILKAGAVERLAGVLRLKSDGEHTYLFLGDEELTNSAISDEDDERLYQLQTGRAYAFYRVPQLAWVMAVEPLDGEDNADPQDRL
jgi:hypothetical protein